MTGAGTRLWSCEQTRIQPPLRKADLNVGTLFQMYGVDKAHLALLERQDQGVGAHALAKESHPPEQVAVGNSGACKDDLLAWGQVLGVIDAFGVCNAHLGQSLFVFGLGNHQSRLDLAVQAPQRRSGQYAFGSATSTHHGVDTSSNYRSRNARREVAIPTQPDARPGGSNVIDEFFVARAVEDDHHQVFHIAVQAPGNRAQVVRYRRIQFDRAFTRRPHDDLFHVNVRRVEQSSLLAGGQYGNGVGRSGGAEVGALERVHSDIHRRVVVFRVVYRRADLFADVQHGGCVPLPFANNDGAIHRHRIHHLAHGLHRYLIRLVPSPQPIVRAAALAAWSPTRRNLQLS